MGHVAEDVSRIAHDLVAAMSFDVTDEPYTTHAAAQEEVMGVKKLLDQLGKWTRCSHVRKECFGLLAAM